MLLGRKSQKAHAVIKTLQPNIRILGGGNLSPLCLNREMVVVGSVFHKIAPDTLDSDRPFSTLSGLLT